MIDKSTLKRDVTLRQDNGRTYATVKLTMLNGNTGTGKAYSAMSEQRAIDAAEKLAMKALGA